MTTLRIRWLWLTCRVGNAVVPVPQHILYKFKGPELDFLSYYEWCAIISIQEQDKPLHSVQTPNFNFRANPLRATHAKKLRSKLQCQYWALIWQEGHQSIQALITEIEMQSGRRRLTFMPGICWQHSTLGVFRLFIHPANPPGADQDGSAWNYNLKEHRSPWAAFCNMCSMLDPRPSDDAQKTFVNTCHFAVKCNVTKALRVNNEQKKILPCIDAEMWSHRSEHHLTMLVIFEILIYGPQANYTRPLGTSANKRAVREEIEKLMRTSNQREPQSDLRAAGQRTWLCS